MNPQDASNPNLSELYAEFEDDDRELAEAGLVDYGRQMTLEDLLEGITEENIHPEISSGPPVGKEVW
ncbi:MAG: hypothetical protein ABI977_34330 [Acidobacteriota bacterium]